MTSLTKSDCDLIRESLRYSIDTFSRYQGYPSEEFRREQIERVRSVQDKVLNIKRALKE